MTGARAARRPPQPRVGCARGPGLGVAAGRLAKLKNGNILSNECLKWQTPKNSTWRLWSSAPQRPRTRRYKLFVADRSEIIKTRSNIDVIHLLKTNAAVILDFGLTIFPTRLDQIIAAVRKADADHMRKIASISLAAFLLSAPVSALATTSGCEFSATMSQRISEKRYKERPETILADYATGGPAMDAMVTAQIAYDPGFIDQIFQLALRASDSQKEALARGLRRFASLCGPSKPDMQRKIIEKIRRSGDKDLIQAYFREDNTPSDPADASLALPPVRPASARQKLPPDYLIGDGLNSVLAAPSASSLPPP